MHGKDRGKIKYCSMGLSVCQIDSALSIETLEKYRTGERKKKRKIDSASSSKTLKKQDASGRFHGMYKQLTQIVQL